VCFSPDGRFLAAGAEDKTVKVWDIEKNNLQHTFHGHELDIYSLDFSADGRFIVSGSGDKKAKIWNMETGKVSVIILTYVSICFLTRFKSSSVSLHTWK
jgi:general transcriptional corepressor TUP1